MCFLSRVLLRRWKTYRAELPEIGDNRKRAAGGPGPTLGVITTRFAQTLRPARGQLDPTKGAAAPVISRVLKRALLYDVAAGLILALLWIIIGPIAGYHHVVGVALVFIFLPWLLATLPLIVIAFLLAQLVRRVRRR